MPYEIGHESVKSEGLKTLLKSQELCICCKEMANVVDSLSSAILPVGSGEISGSVSLDFHVGRSLYRNEHDVFELSVDDGWSVSARIPFRHCPFCGLPPTKRVSEHLPQQVECEKA